MIEDALVKEPQRHLMPFDRIPRFQKVTQHHDSACPCIRCKVPLQGLIWPLIPSSAASAPVVSALSNMPMVYSSLQSKDDKTTCRSKSNEDVWFYLAEYHDMVDELPDPRQFVSIIVKIHQESMDKSPSGKFGFDVPTHLANIPIDNDWEETWETFFTKAMKRMLELEELSHGKDDKEFEDLKEKLLTKVIPRLLIRLSRNLLRNSLDLYQTQRYHIMAQRNDRSGGSTRSHTLA